VKSAVQSISTGSSKSPTGTAKFKYNGLLIQGCSAVQMRLYRDDTVEGAHEEIANGALTDGFARVERGVLAHVAEIRRNQHQPSGSSTTRCFRREQKCDQLFVRIIERTANDGRRCGRPDGNAQLSVGKSMQGNFMPGNAKPLCELSANAGGGRQPLDRGTCHALSPPGESRPSIK